MRCSTDPCRASQNLSRGRARLFLIVLAFSAGSVLFLAEPSLSMTCNAGSDGSARNSGGVVTGTSGRTQRCLGGEGGSPSTSVEQLWAAHCHMYGSFGPGAGVEMVRGESVAAGEEVFVGDSGQAVSVRVESQAFRWTIMCTTAQGATLTYVTALPVGVAPVDPVVLRDQAVASLTIPDPVLGGNPPLDDPDRHSVVRIPTWLWIAHPWESLFASAADGGVAVSVTATPTHVTWDPGDGSGSFDCSNAGVVWRPGAKVTSETCLYEYVRSSAGEGGDAFRLTATVSWSLTWSINGVDQGQFDVYQPSESVDHQVGEIQAIES